MRHPDELVILETVILEAKRNHYFSYLLLGGRILSFFVSERWPIF